MSASFQVPNPQMAVLDQRNGLAASVWFRFWTGLFNVANSGGKIVGAGSTALVAGSVVISTAQAVTGNAYILTRKITGGTPGDLEIGAIVNGVSFEIVSSDVGDTSTVSWLIVEPF